MTRFWNVKTACLTGRHRHASKAEARYCDTLSALTAEGRLRGFKTQVGYALLALHGTNVATHYVDFEVVLPDGRVEAHEVKGRSGDTALWRLKRKLFEDNWPAIKYVVIGGAAWTRRRRRTTRRRLRSGASTRPGISSSRRS